MDRALILALGGFFCLETARADLLLTPTLSQYDLDGVKMQQLLFPDGQQNVIYTPPRGWKYSANDGRLALRPSEVGTGEAEIKVLKLAEAQVFDDATMKQLCEGAVASLPSSATRVTIVSQQKNPLLIERKETFMVEIKYDCFGDSYARSVMFLNRKNEQLRFQLTCRQAIYPQLQKAFLGSQYSWQNL